MPGEPTHAEIKSLIISEIKQRRYHLDRSFQIIYLERPIEEHLRQTYGEPARERHANLFNDVVWDLILSGIIAPWNSRNRDYSFLHVTAYGQTCIESGITLAYDPDGFLSEVARRVPRLDKVALLYLGEAVAGFNKGLLLSSTVMLGTVSEYLILLLINAYAKALQPGNRPTFQRKIERAWIATQFEEFENSFMNKVQSGAAPEQFEQDFRNCIKPLFELYRQNRNLAGHPSGITMDQDILRAHLQAFPSYADRLFKLIEFLDGKVDQL